MTSAPEERPAPRTDFDPVVFIRGRSEPIETLLQAEEFVRQHPEIGGHNREGILRRLQVAATPEDRHHAADAFRGWLEANGLLAGESKPRQT